MELEDKKITFHINNRAYTVNIGSDLDGRVRNGIKEHLNINTDLLIEDLLLAYLKKTQELILVEKDIENQLHALNTFKQTTIH